MQDLFLERTIFDPVRLPGADVSYLQAFDLGVPPLQMMQALIDETPWRQHDIKL